MTSEETDTEPTPKPATYSLEQLAVHDSGYVWLLNRDADGLTEAESYIDATMRPDVQWDETAARQWANDVLTSRRLVDRPVTWRAHPNSIPGEAAFTATA